MASAIDCTVIVSTNDGYRDLWTPFFTLLKKNWDVPFPIILNTESDSFSFEGLDIRSLALYKKGDKPAWSERLIKTLESIDTEYVLTLLEDFFLTAPVDTARLDDVFRWMDADKNIAVFSFLPAPGDNIKSDRYPGFELRAQRAPYRFNAQAAVWRRERLIDFLRPDESAWEWEHNGNERSFALQDEFYSALQNEPQVFPYDPFEHGVYNGRWLTAVPALFAKNGIDMDFSVRGFFDEKQRALHPQVGVDFKNDAALYLDFGAGFDESSVIMTENPDESDKTDVRFEGLDRLGSFSPSLRLDPTTSGYCMYEKLTLTLGYGDGTSETLGVKSLSGNGIHYGSSLVFFNADPQILFDAQPKKQLCSLRLTGTNRRRIPENVIDAVLGRRPCEGIEYRARHILTKLKGIL